jgi:hypothetical protein
MMVCVIKPAYTAARAKYPLGGPAVVAILEFKL